jgi:hypothetical protein
MTRTIVLLLFTIIAQAVLQDIRTLLLSKMTDIKYQCVNPGCSPSTIAFVLSLRACQVVCLSDDNCRTVTFDLSNNQCELFADILSQYGNMLAQTGVVTMTAIDDKQLPARK